MDVPLDEDELYRSLEQGMEDDEDEYIDDVGDDDEDYDDGDDHHNNNINNSVDYPIDIVGGRGLMRLIRLYDWAGSLARVSSYPDECRVIGEHRRLPLHVACDNDAPAVVIQALLKAYPEASIKVGTTNMNPLHITCSSQKASVHIVRTLLENGRMEQFSMRDIDGDTPLHTACRCGAPIEVLELLLRVYHPAVYERDYEGLTPVQRLWVRYFVTLGADTIDSVNSADDLVGDLLEAWKKTELLLRCAHYGHLDNTKPIKYRDNSSSSTSTHESDRVMSSLVSNILTLTSFSTLTFRAVHAAVAVDCPRAVVKIATKIYPNQLNERDEYGRTPLLIAAAAPIYEVRDLSDNGFALEENIYDDNTGVNANTSGRHYQIGANDVNNSSGVDKGQESVIEILLDANQDCARRAADVMDPSGRLPLHLALASKKRWHEGIKQLIAAYPESLSIPDQSSRLYPFAIAATAATYHIRCNYVPSNASSNYADYNDGDVNTTYELLRANPCIIENLVRHHSRKGKTYIPTVMDSSHPVDL